MTLRALASDAAFYARLAVIGFPIAFLMAKAEREAEARLKKRALHPLDLPEPQAGHREGRV